MVREPSRQRMDKELTKLLADSSPLLFRSSSPTQGANGQRRAENPRSSSALFLGSSDTATPNASRLNQSRRGDIHSERLGSATARSHGLFVDERGVPVRGDGGSDAVTYSQLDPTTSDANRLAGGSNPNRIIWGTTVSIQDTMSAFKDFVLNYTKKYRMWADGATEEETRAQAEVADQKEYVDMLQNMRAMGLTSLNVDVRNLKAYPRTLKLWHQLQSYPQEVIPLLDQTLKDVMLEETIREANERRIHQQSGSRHGNGVPSSEINFAGSDPGLSQPNANAISVEDKEVISDVEARIYKIRPFGLDKSINLRDLNPAGTWCFGESKVWVLICDQTWTRWLASKD